MTVPTVRSPLLWLVAIGFLMQTLDTTIVNTALPAMAATLGESPLHMQSVVVGYTLTMAMLIPASGWLADRVGTRPVYLSAIVLFVAGSVLCALSTSLYALVAARVVQGCGGAMLMPVGRLAVLRAYPPPLYLAAMSFVTVPGLVGPLVGPTLGGWLVEVASWHWIFWINVPIGALGCAAALRYMANTRGTRVGRFDVLGYAMIAFGMVAVSLALDGLSELALGRAIVLVLFLLGLASLAAYWLHAAQAPAPLFSPSIFRVPSFSVGLLGNLFSRLGSGGMPFLLPLLLQVSLGYTPVQSGMTMIPVALAAMLTKRWVPMLITRFGYRNVLVGNTLCVGAAIASFALVAPGQGLAFRLAQLVAYGALNSLQFSSMNTIVLRDLSREQASEGNTLLSMTQMLAMGLGVAVAGGLLAAFTDAFGHADHAQTLRAFHSVFLCAGLLTAASAAIFSQLSVAPGAGPESVPGD